MAVIMMVCDIFKKISTTNRLCKKHNIKIKYDTHKIRLQIQFYQLCEQFIEQRLFWNFFTSVAFIYELRTSFIQQLEFFFLIKLFIY
jgi:hypothetical protein